MLMGAGKMAELTARQLNALGIQSLLITSRTFDRAVALARDLGGTAVPYDNYKPYLKMVDVLIGSVSSTKPILGPDEFESVVRERRYRPMFLIDMGVPRNFDERLNALQNVYLYDIDDLGALVQRSLGDREREAEKAEQIVELELESFLKWLAGLDLTPTIKDIRYSVERLRDDELGRARGWMAQLDPAERERVELLTRGLTNKLLHRILSGLKQRDDKTLDAAFAAEVARRLLGAEFDAQDDDLDDADNDNDDDDAVSSDHLRSDPLPRLSPLPVDGKGLGVTVPRCRSRSESVRVPANSRSRKRRSCATASPHKFPAAEIEIIEIRTSGDKMTSASLADVGGKGLFIKELEQALADRTIDAAVHSMKDLPAILPEQFRVAAVLERENTADILVTRDGSTLSALPAGARLGTSSSRRRFQALRMNRGLEDSAAARQCRYAAGARGRRHLRRDHNRDGGGEAAGPSRKM